MQKERDTVVRVDVPKKVLEKKEERTDNFSVDLEVA